MPLYDYFCPHNDRTVEVRHSIHDKLETWGQLCQLLQCELGDTPENAPIRRLISAPRLMVPAGDSDYKSSGMQKLVRRDKGVYEDVTATDKSQRIISIPD
jgi:hypothetical protein